LSGSEAWAAADGAAERPFKDGGPIECPDQDDKNYFWLALSSGSSTEFSVVSQSLAMRSENAGELNAFCAVFT
jgi:hypothetical protein